MKKKFWIGLVGAVCVLGIVVSLFGMAQRPSYIYMVRHGRTYANEQGLLMGGDGNADLTPEAVEQAKTVGQDLADVSFGKVYTSTLGRTLIRQVIFRRSRAGECRPATDGSLG